MSTYKELQNQISELKKQAEALLKVERNQVIKNIIEQMVIYEISPQELTTKGKSHKPRKTSLTAKFKDPASDRTWSGRGRQPAWITRAREEYLIK